MKISYLLIITIALDISACSPKPDYTKADTVINSSNQQIKLAPPYATKSVRNYCEVIGWVNGEVPTAPAGFKVNLYAGGLDNPRNIYAGPNGDVFTAQATTEIDGIKKIGANIIGAGKSENINKSPNNIMLLRDTNGDGAADIKTVFLSRLNKPYGLLILNNWFYVANTDGVWRYPYKPGQTNITVRGTKILSLPAGGYNNHWTRNLRTNANCSKIYVSVGSGTNDAEKGLENEVRRADILEINPDGSNEHIYASGLRNPAGIDFQPGTGVLWASVNERDGLGDNIVPDYLTSVKQGGFYGWPWAYFGPHEDPDHKNERPDMVKKAIVPDVALGSHTASLGLAFYGANKFPQRYHGGAFIGQHGSWNSSKLVGYKVVFVPFVNSKPGKPEDFLTGFVVNEDKKEVHGRPVGIAVLNDGSLLVADDAGNKIWRVSTP
jgi:glucose/arabinose dehydrogenase